MDEFLIMLRNVLLFVALAVPGFLLVKGKVLKPEQSGALSKILMYLAMPFLIFSGVVKNLAFDEDTLLMMGVVALIGVAYIFVMFFTNFTLKHAINMQS